MKTVLLNIFISFLSIIFCLLALEAYFAFFFTESSGLGYTLASKTWYKRYWHPINSLDYRDYEHNQKDLEQKNVIYVVGDSFTAAAGTKNIDDRYANRLQAMLGDNWEVVVIADPGWTSSEAADGLYSYPYKSNLKLVILGYYINDSDLAVKKVYGRPPGYSLERPGKFTKTIIDNSHFLNFVYWRVRTQGSEGYRKMLEQRWQNLRIIALDPEVRAAHKKELSRFVSYSENNNVPLAVVVFPNLLNTKVSKILTDPVVHYFTERNVDVIDLDKHLEDKDPKQLVASSMDNHPSVYLHNFVAELIYKKYKDSIFDQ